VHLYSQSENKSRQTETSQPDYVTSVGKGQYQIDLTKPTLGKGSFNCPKCKTEISPDDKTEENYQIIGTKVKNDVLTELDLQCKKCGTIFRLVGFNYRPKER
jgi:RNase P subunit RPR2